MKSNSESGISVPACDNDRGKEMDKEFYRKKALESGAFDVEDADQALREALLSLSMQLHWGTDPTVGDLLSTQKELSRQNRNIADSLEDFVTEDEPEIVHTLRRIHAQQTYNLINIADGLNDGNLPEQRDLASLQNRLEFAAALLDELQEQDGGEVDTNSLESVLERARERTEEDDVV